MTNLNRNEVSIEIENILRRTEPSERTKWCIYRVPNEIRELNKEVYTPQAVSIGPFHYKDEKLKNMQTHKWEYFKKFLERTKIDLDNLVSFIEKLEPSVRLCYAEDIVLDKKEFIKIISLDACFLIELFLRDYQNRWSRDDPLSSSTRLSDSVAEDLLLLENQLPFFILDNLFNWAFSCTESSNTPPESSHTAPGSSNTPPASSNMPSFLELTFKYFNYFNRQELNPDDVKICHFTDLLRFFHLQHPSSSQPTRIEDNEVLKFSASKLHEAGLKFKVKVESKCLLGLHFSGRVLEIPKIVVEDWTDFLFHNMVALEQCHYPYESYITDYVTVLDSLIDTDKDVDVLVENGIIINKLDDRHAVAKLINGLVKNVIWANFNSAYVQLFRELNKFHKNPYQKLKTTLRRDYCKTPWQIVASIAGILLLFLTLIQTIYSVIQVM